MKFEVFGPDGRRMMYTEHPECVPDLETQRAMKAAGYKIRHSDCAQEPPKSRRKPEKPAEASP